MSHHLQALEEATERCSLAIARYMWLRQNPAWETEAYLAGLSPEEFDAAVDAARGATA